MDFNQYYIENFSNIAVSLALDSISYVLLICCRKIIREKWGIKVKIMGLDTENILIKLGGGVFSEKLAQA